MAKKNLCPVPGLSLPIGFIFGNKLGRKMTLEGGKNQATAANGFVASVSQVTEGSGFSFESSPSFFQWQQIAQILFLSSKGLCRPRDQCFFKANYSYD